MPDTVLLALKNKLARYETSGEADRVKQVKARIAELEKGEKKAATALPMTLSPSIVPAPADSKSQTFRLEVQTKAANAKKANKAAAPKKAAGKKK